MTLDEEQVEIKREYRLTPQETRLLTLMYRRLHVTRDSIMSALYDDQAHGDCAYPKIIDVLICRLRKKLREFDIHIETIHSAGFRLLPASKVHIKDMLNQLRAAA